MVIPVAIVVMRLQTNLQRKLWAITVFVCRLVYVLLSSVPNTIKSTDIFRVWVPTWIHLSLYIKFIQRGRVNIDIVPTMVTEELWVALALVSASTPVLMRVAKKFTTFGMTLTTSMAYGSRGEGNSKDSSTGRRRTGFRPDDVTNTSHVDAHMLKTMNEGASIGSTAESQIGILRQVDFQVSSETKEHM